MSAQITQNVVTSRKLRRRRRLLQTLFGQRRWLTWFWSGSGGRVEDDFDAAVLLFAEDFVGVWGLAERESMRDDEAWVDSAAADVVEQLGDVAMHVSLACFDRQAFVH